jgi:arylsulfatase A-like enzyme
LNHALRYEEHLLPIMTGTDRRSFLRGSAAAVAGIALASCRLTEGGPAAGQKRPNTVFVFPDQFRRQALGFMGEDPTVTPNLDRLAAQGTTFTRTCSVRPVCSPARATMLTGTYPLTHGVVTNCYQASAPYGVELRRSDRCLSDVLHDAGYATGYIGKWHLEAPHEPYVEPPRRWDGNVWDEFTPHERRHGFEFWHSYGAFDDHLQPHYWTTDAGRSELITVDEWSPRHEADVAIDFIRKRDRAKPFALFVSMNPPHPPYNQTPAEYQDVYGDATPEELLNRPNVDLSLDTDNTRLAERSVKGYFGAVTGVDDQIGRILLCLNEEGLAEDTIFIFTSDHGDMMGSHDRNGKTVWYEESFAVPFIMRWPGHIPAGRRDDLLLSFADLLPSFLSLAGLGDRTPDAVEGSDHSGIMLGREGPRPESALYLSMGAPHPERGMRGVRTQRYTFVMERRGGEEQYTLHDNEEDPYQMRSVAGDDPGLVADLRAETLRWLRDTGDPWLSTGQA